MIATSIYLGLMFRSQNSTMKEGYSANGWSYMYVLVNDT